MLNFAVFLPPRGEIWVINSLKNLIVWGVRVIMLVNEKMGMFQSHTAACAALQSGKMIFEV